jgi:hypothetical protein
MNNIGLFQENSPEHRAEDRRKTAFYQKAYKDKSTTP